VHCGFFEGGNQLKNSIIAFVAACAVSFAGAVAQAAFVTPTNSVTFAFDVSGLGDTTFTRFIWCGDQELSCFNSPTNTLDEEFGPGATMQLDFGTIAGGGDIGTSFFTNSFSDGSDNFSTDLPPNQSILASLTTLFVTLIYVDDVYGATQLGLRFSGNNIIYGEMLPPSEVPLPAALPLFLMGAAGLGFAGKRKRRLA
jgi:PEP-CTERM motif